ncbi:hypothetical protein DFQ26_007804, partial [Actinomortierella ambigua]
TGFHDERSDAERLYDALSNLSLDELSRLLRYLGPSLDDIFRRLLEKIADSKNDVVDDKNDPSPDPPKP